MDYIITPAWFYWVRVAQTVNLTVSILAGLLGLACLGLAAIRMAMVGEYDEEEPEVKTVKRLLKIVFPLTILFVILAIFVPSKETLIEMQVAKFATFDNARLTIDAVKNAVDYIISTIKGG
ncbi:MAG: hypothetical protein J6S67_19090 [Methanobrevibacter sp.]|nr:hypothetical protein [Methanobrevibacter sp.]